MEITYIGHSCFRIKGKDITVVIDPYNPKSTGYKLPPLSCDMLLVSHNHEDHNYSKGVSDFRLLINGPGEYEMKDVFVYGFATYHDERSGSMRGENTVYLIEIDGFSILHLGDLGHELPEDVLENLPDIDVLLIPVGGVFTVDAEIAAEVISELEPGIVIPMHYQTKDLTAFSKPLDSLDKFLDEMGKEKVKNQDKLLLKAKSDVPEDTEVVVLDQKH